MEKLTIIIPILNEVNNIQNIFDLLQSYSPRIKVHLCDGGSTDGTLEKLKSNQESLKYTLHHSKLISPSVQKTINLATKHIETKYFMIHPVDAKASLVIEKFLNMEGVESTHFIPYKEYDSRHYILNLQEKILNSLRVKILKSFVWTNCPIIETSSYLKVSTEPEGFLEDVILSDQLKALNSQPVIIKDLVTISSRRYQADGVLQRFLGNLLIMVLFRFKLKSIEELKNMYYKKK